MTGRPKGTPRSNTFIKVENPSERVYTAKLYIRNMEECSVEYVAPKDDKAPGSSAVALLWHRFHQRVGANIRYGYERT